MADVRVFGWDIGGAHVKACRSVGATLDDVAQWPCPLWQGIDHLERAIDAAHERWPDLADANACHALTMSGETVDLFPDRRSGVARIAGRLAARLTPARVWVFAGDRGWLPSADAAAAWDAVASANWLATARHVAQALPHAAGVLVDIGSTSTDIVAFCDGSVPTPSRSDADRLASGELVYQGVVRTPLCALARRVAWRGRQVNVMNEFFATSADVHRLLGGLDPAHDQHPSADGQGKDAAATHQRLARMVGLDAGDAGADEWAALAREWRSAQLDVIGADLQRVLSLHGLGPDATLVAAGCGDFLLPELAARAGLASGLRYAGDVARLSHDRPLLQRWAQVCAPAVAVAALHSQRPELR